MATTSFSTSITIGSTTTAPPDGLWDSGEIPPSVCGYISGYLASPVGCDTGYICATLSSPKFVACCTDTEPSYGHCLITPSCVDGYLDPYESTRAFSSSNPTVLTCTSDGLDKCCYYEFIPPGEEYQPSLRYTSFFCGAPTSLLINEITVPWTPRFWSGFSSLDYGRASYPGFFDTSISYDLGYTSQSSSYESTSSSSSSLPTTAGASSSYTGPGEPDPRALPLGLGLGIPLTLIASGFGIWAFIVYKRRTQAIATSQQDQRHDSSGGQVQSTPQRSSLDRESMIQVDPPPPYLASPDFTHIESH